MNAAFRISLLTIYFSEISFLRLIHMDLSANRITTLPVELRFMNSVVELNLGENPLSCPPANVSSATWYNNIYYIYIQHRIRKFPLKLF